LTRPALAGPATGVAGWDRARTSGNSMFAAGILPRPAGDASEKAQ